MYRGRKKSKRIPQSLYIIIYFTHVIFQAFVIVIAIFSINLKRFFKLRNFNTYLPHKLKKINKKTKIYS